MGSGLAILTHATLFPWPGRCASNIRCGAKGTTPLTSPGISFLLTPPLGTPRLPECLPLDKRSFGLTGGILRG